MTRRERARRRRRNKRAPAQMVFLGLGIMSTILVGSIIGLLVYVITIASSGPSLKSLEPQGQGTTSTVYAADGSRLGFISSEILRTPIAAADIPQVMRDATVAIEDRRFFDHKGVDFEGVVRAAVKNISSGETVQGGSTLSMQLIRNLYTGDRERNFKRKLREARLAEELENAHPGREGKLWILNQYINNVPYGTSGGQSAVGVQAAARIFFSKPARDLTLPEAALLAGLPQAPTTYNPNINAQGAMKRRNDVLRQMAEERMITREQADAAIASPLGVTPGRFYRERREGYFFDFVTQELIDKYGVNTVRRGGLKVHTAVEPRFQKAARIALNQATAGLDRSAAIVSIDPRTGFIRAMATTGQYGQFKFNLAAQGHYAAGSTFKTMVLMAALERGVDPRTTTYVSKPLKFVDPQYGQIDVTTYDNSYIGRANLVTATLRSDNSIFQQLDLDIGPERVADVAKRMGITTKLDGIPAEGLGGLRLGVSPLEMASAYATIASYGYATKPTAIRRVCVPLGDEEGFDCQDTEPVRRKEFRDGVAAMATEILKQNITSGTGGAANIGCPAAGKTGTVDDFTDAWFVGYTPRLSTAVWVGHANERRTLGGGAAGGSTAAPIWGQYMKTARSGYCGDWPAPKQPFKPVPFFGKYSRAGAPGTGYVAPVQSPPAPQQSGGVNSGGERPAQAEAPAAAAPTQTVAPIQQTPDSGGTAPPATP